MGYTEIVSRTDAAAVIKPEQVSGIVKEATQASMALSLFRRIPILGTQTSFPVLATLPSASWINPADTGLLQTTDATWSRTYCDVADLGVIVTVPKSVAADALNSGVNITDELRPILAEAAGIAIDQAIFFGTGAPSEWSHFTAITTDAAAVTGTISPTSANTYSQGTNSASKGGLAEDLNQCMKIMAAQGYRPNAIAARSTFEFDLESARDTTGQRLLDLGAGTFKGRPIMFGGDGVFPAEGTGVVNAFVMDSNKFLIGIRQDMELTISDSATISNGSGVVTQNLWQQNLVALKLVMRVGVAVAKPVTRAQATAALRYPAVTLLGA